MASRWEHILPPAVCSGLQEETKTLAGSGPIKCWLEIMFLLKNQTNLIPSNQNSCN